MCSKNKLLIANEDGFTLVELAIVLMIIGLLIGGILRGQELLNNARISTTVQQIKSYQGAVATFQDAYTSLPGDMPTATARLPNCTSANKCQNGNGDSIVGTLQIGFGLMTLQTGAAAPYVETSMFWKHLAAAHIISGVDPSADPATPVIGITHPSARIGGGFMVSYGSHFITSKTGLALTLTNKLSGNVGESVYVPTGGNPITPVQARQLDNKMDDGLADVGDVYAPDDGTCDHDVGTGVREYWTTENKSCVLVFNIQ